MVKFKKAYKQTIKHEGAGVYSDRVDDAGRETYSGISRKKHPTWEGWTRIDFLKATYGEAFKKYLKGDNDLHTQVVYFYEKEFWDKLSLSGMTKQVIANKVFDIAVNCGKSFAGKALQRTLNVLNRCANDWPDIKVDGKIGRQTITVCNQAVRKRKKNIWKELNILQGYRYTELAENPKRRDEMNINGWLNLRIGFLNINEEDKE
jgi:lysozyme family protein